MHSIFEEAEWKALVAYKTKSQIPPLNPPSLREAVQNGGKFRWFLGRKGDGEPGTQTLWLGIQRLDDMTAMWKVLLLNLPLIHYLHHDLSSKKCG